MDEDETYEQKFQRLGVDHVRILVITGDLPMDMRMRAAAVAWLAQRDADQRLRDECTASSARKAAWVAAVASIIAAVAAIVGIFV